MKSVSNTLLCQVVDELVECWDFCGPSQSRGPDMTMIDGVDDYFSLRPSYEKLEKFIFVVDQAFSKMSSDASSAELYRDVVWRTHLPYIERRLKRLSGELKGRLFVYGGGTHTFLLWPLLQRYFGGVEAVLDRDPDNAAFSGSELLDVRAFEPKERDVVVLSSMTYESEMEAYLVKHFGRKFQIVSLYQFSAWDAFRDGLSREKCDANTLFDAFHEWMASHPQRCRINASGFLLCLQAKLGRVNTSDQIRLLSTFDGNSTRFLASALSSVWKSRALALKESFTGAQSFCWFDCYALGDYIMGPILSVCNVVLEEVDRVVLLVSDDETMRHIPGDLDERIVVLELKAPPLMARVLYEEYSVEFEGVERDFESAPISLKAHFGDMREELRGLHGLASVYRSFLSWLSDEIEPCLFVNLQDNRMLSRAFHYAFKDDRVPCFQLQHGILSSGLTPFWADFYLGWKDPHSIGIYKQLSFDDSEFFSLGNFNANQMADSLKERVCPDIVSEKPLFVFYFQGPAFWHVTYFMINHALDMIISAALKCSDRWRFAIRMRKQFGESLLLDLFAERGINGEIEIISADEDKLDVFNRSDLVGVISTSASQEGHLFGKPALSIESDQVKGIARLSEWGLGRRVRCDSELIAELDDFLERGWDRKPLKEENPYLKVLPEDIAKLRSLLRRVLQPKDTL